MAYEGLMRALVIDEYGSDANISYKEIPIPRLQSGQVLIKVEVAPIHQIDLDFISGKFYHKKTLPTVPGFEGAGFVVKSGGGVNSWRLEGKRVCFMQLDPTLPGSWAEYTVVNTKTCCVLNTELDIIKGSAMMIHPLMIMLMADCIKKGKHKAIIHTLGASTIGKTLIRWCHYTGITCINVVTREDQEEVIRSLAADYIIRFDDDDFDEKLREICQEVKPTCAFDPIGGELAGKIFNALEVGGEMFLYGEHGNLPLCGVHSSEFIINRKQIKGLPLFHWYENTSIVKRYKLLQKIQKLHYIFKTEFASVLPLSLYQDAITLTKSIHSSNKVLLHIGAKEMKPMPIREENSKEEEKTITDNKKLQNLPKQASIHELDCSEIEIVKEADAVESDFYKPESEEVEISKNSGESEEESEEERLTEVIKEYESSTVLRMSKKFPPFVWDSDLNDGVEVHEEQLKMLPDFSIYKGQWANNACHGRGIRYYYDGSVYEGYWKNGRVNGKGRFLNADGEFYEGMWEDAKHHGKGKLITEDGTQYDGVFDHDVIVSGIEISPERERYEGSYENGQKHGNGTYEWPDGLRYEGMFSNGEINGEGKLHYTEKKRFEGTFKGLNAEGVMYYEDGSKFLGSLIDGKENGEGIYMSPDGKSKQGIWSDGKLDSWNEEDI